MDPNANLAAQAEAIQEIAEYEADNTAHHPACVNARAELDELRRSLRTWLSRGGFEPNWEAHPEATRTYGDWALAVRSGQRWSVDRTAV